MIKFCTWRPKYQGCKTSLSNFKNNYNKKKSKTSLHKYP